MFGSARVVAATIAGCGCAAMSCAATPEVIETVSADRRPSDADIDEDPWRLLPPGGVAFLRADQAVWKADFADDLASTLQRVLPFSEGAGIEPQTDIHSMIGVMYATVQNDVAFIGSGSYEPEEVKRAIAKSPRTQNGKLILTVEFAGETMYVAEQAAMTVLTEKTIVFGTQLGVRRVLEVVEEGRMHRALPSWFEALLKQPGAHMQLGIDLDAQPVPAVVRTRLTFLNHLRAARLIGNYKGGGLNLAGSLTFDTPQAAEQAAQQFNSADEQLERYQLVMHALSMPEPFHTISGKATGKDTQFAVEMEPDAISFLLLKGGAVLSQLLGEE